MSKLVYEIRNRKIKFLEGRIFYFKINTNSLPTTLNSEELLNRPYKWLQKKLEEINRREKIDDLEGWVIIFTDKEEEDEGGCRRKEKWITMNPSTPGSAEATLIHELVHAIRGKIPYEIPDATWAIRRNELLRRIDEGGARFGELLYGIERGEEVAEDIFHSLLNVYYYTRSRKNYKCELCTYLDIANKYGLNEALKSSIELFTPEEFERRYGEFPIYEANCLLECKEFSKYLKILDNKSGKNNWRELEGQLL